MTLLDRITLALQGVGADVKSILTKVLPTGGTTGQVLSKSSATNYAVAWTNIVAAVLAGYVSTTGTLAATDTIVAAISKLNGNIALKANISATQDSLLALTFAVDCISGTPTAPVTGNITGVTTGAQLGVIRLVVHNSATAPTFDSKFKKLSGSGAYVVSVVNYIYCQYISATEIVYSINQRT